MSAHLKLPRKSPFLLMTLNEIIHLNLDRPATAKAGLFFHPFITRTG
jgi:hypothetical protein